jgi:hypothetical protein
MSLSKDCIHDDKTDFFVELWDYYLNMVVGKFPQLPSFLQDNIPGNM